MGWMQAGNRQCFPGMEATGSTDQVVRTLREIAALLRIRGESTYRARAYDVAADRIAQVQGDLGELVRQRRLTELPGIGDALAAKISEIVQTGRSETLEELHQEYPPGILELTKVPELGPKKAQALWKALGVRDLDELERACRGQRVRHVPGFGERTEARILQAIEAWRAVPPRPDRRLLGNVLPRALELLRRVRGAPGVLQAELAGSVRRACEEVADIDVVAAAKEPSSVLAALGDARLARTLSPGRYELTFGPDDLRLDVRVVPEEAFAAALVVETGARAHVEKLRALALARAFRLEDDGLFRANQRVLVQDEAAVYDALGLPFIPPELREDTGEIEAGLNGTRFTDLISLTDVVGVVHSHSTWSDGKSSLEEMARAARDRGLRFLTVTEHSQSAGYAGGLKEADLRKQWDEIDALNGKLDGITLLKGIESDILADGSLDFPDHVLKQLDVVIGSVHQRHKMDRAQMTERILHAFDNPHLHILGHATGRLIQKREPAPLDMEAILDKAAERGVVVEVNGNPLRLDLKAEHVRKAVGRGVALVVSADSHSTREIDHLGYAVSTARKGWARRGDILNTLEAGDFSASLRRLRGSAPV